MNDRLKIRETAEEVREMWNKFEKNHPVAYEVIQWVILGLAAAALLK